MGTRFLKEPPANNKSGVVGVHYKKRENKYGAVMGYENKKYCLGYFDDIEVAATMRKKAEQSRSNGRFLEWYYNEMPLLKLSLMQSACQTPKNMQQLEFPSRQDDEKECAEPLQTEVTSKETPVYETKIDRATRNAYLDKVSETYNMTRKEYLAKLLDQDMLVHPEIIEKIKELIQYDTKN